MLMNFFTPVLELLTLLLLLALAVLASRYAAGRSRLAGGSRTVLWAWWAIPLAIGSIAWYFNQVDSVPQPADRPIELHEDGFVSSDSCRSCHPGQHKSWHASYHRTMTQLATAETVIGEFDGRILERDGHEFSVFKKGDKFMVNLVDDRGEIVDQPIVMTTGLHHMQVYWFSTGSTRMLGQFPFVYLRKEKRWISSDASFLNPHPEEELTTGQLTHVALWNHTCLKCHVTNPKSLIETHGLNQQVTMQTQVAEFGIACEACHGPGKDHVAANQNPLRRYRQHLLGTADQTITNPRRLDHRKASQVCGICHSITYMGGGEEEILWRERGNTFRPGDEISDHREIISYAADPALLKEITEQTPDFLADRFWSDGMVRVSGREFNGLRETKCYTHGEMSCLSCHTMHPPDEDPQSLARWADDQLKAGMRTNQACVSCHPKYAGETQRAEHTHHAADSSGSLCYNCHMPHTTYGLMKAIRSHQIDIPSVQASVKTGRPNACNLCHLDQTMDWSAGHLEEWYDIARPELDEDQQQVAASILWLLKGDAGQRALMAWAMGWTPAREASGEDWMASYLGQLLVDPYDAVRFIAERSLRRLEPYGSLEYDFLGAEDQRQAALQRVRQTWSELNFDRERWRSGEDVFRRLLIDESGTIDFVLFQRFLGERDNRRVNLAE